jgi:hypothetical protein
LECPVGGFYKLQVFFLKVITLNRSIIVSEYTKINGDKWRKIESKDELLIYEMFRRQVVVENATEMPLCAFTFSFQKCEFFYLPSEFLTNLISEKVKIFNNNFVSGIQPKNLFFTFTYFFVIISHVN